MKEKKPIKDMEKIAEEIKREKERPDWVKTGVAGFDELLTQGIPQGRNILVSGGPGTGKTVFCLQILYNAARDGHPCLYVTFEEPAERLWEHMEKFGWGDAKKLERKLAFTIRDMNPYEIVRSVEAMFEESAGRLPIDLEETPQLIPTGLEPWMIAIDSLSALSSAFKGKREGYRLYIEQLFRLFEKKGATSFLTYEIESTDRYSTSGVEEFLADGVVVLYNFKIEYSRIRGIEVLKMRGAEHKQRIVPMKISDKGIEIYPEEGFLE